MGIDKSREIELKLVLTFDQIVAATDVLEDLYLTGNRRDLAPIIFAFNDAINGSFTNAEINEYDRKGLKPWEYISEEDRLPED